MTQPSTPGVAHIELAGRRVATVIRATARVEHTTFFSDPDASFQVGLLAHQSGFHEAAHLHKPMIRRIEDVQQFFMVQRGVVQVEFHDDDGRLLHDVTLRSGDAIVLIAGGHAIRVLEDAQCVSVKQGPFLGPENDKIALGEHS